MPLMLWHVLKISWKSFWLLGRRHEQWRNCHPVQAMLQCSFGVLHYHCCFDTLKEIFLLGMMNQAMAAGGGVRHTWANVRMLYSHHSASWYGLATGRWEQRTLKYHDHRLLYNILVSHHLAIWVPDNHQVETPFKYTYFISLFYNINY